MSWKILPLWICLAFPAVACAQSASAEHPAEDAPRGPPVIKSSLAVLLEHSTELALTTEQAAWLEQREQQLQQENADTRASNEAETVLTEAQKPRARELISEEREKFLQQREAMRQQRQGGSR